ncbi:MAG: MoaD/ThiS family protein [Actinomycetota bacterium]|nr:MoaD/ThiS family protein [Actinomycetota bacterium]
MADGSLVTVRLPQSLAEHAGGRRELAVDVPPGATLADVLDVLATMAPGVDRRVRDETGAVRRFVNVYVDEDECRTLDGLRTPVPPGTVLFVIPSVAGGAA